MSKHIRCAIYTRKSTDEGLEQDFNSLDAQRESCEAYIQSQRGLGWIANKKRYDDGGYSGGTMERPALQSLLADIDNGKVDLIVVYKVDRLTRSLMDFSGIIENLDARMVSFVSVTQQFNTANSMGRLTLNVLLSFAQFEREVTAERIRDKIAASKKKGMWMGGMTPLGYDAVDKKLRINMGEAEVVRTLFDQYLELGSVRNLKIEADRRGLKTKKRKPTSRCSGGLPFSRGHLYQLLHNPLYIGQIAHKGKTYPGQHEAIVERNIWEKVQAMLDDQAPARTFLTNTKRKCLLTGLAFDERGDRLSPSYTRKAGRHYRYYVSHRLTQGADTNDGWRIPAGQLEQAVLREICRFLDDGIRIADTVHTPGTTPVMIQAYVAEAARISKEIRDEQTKTSSILVRQIIERIDFNTDQLRIKISIVGLSECIGSEVDSGSGSITLETPITFRRCGVESKIILPGDANAPLRDNGLISLVSSTHHWAQKIFRREVNTVREISLEDGTDEGDVSRFLPLAFLAPDIVEAIINGKQPTGLTPEKLKRLRDLPKSWEEQRKILGFIG
jgi:site-specific DNA recombinase